ncbi:MAG: ACP S-malonyltransferase [Candidatus Sericytochromatia bacterium]|nr:ACP S-malonyltransferase [Candidatus Sericytochromatia bacterium]
MAASASSLIAFVYPGQGSQFVGMGREMALAWPEAREVIDEVSRVTGVPLWRLMTEGPAEDLTYTRHAQLALLACGIAATRILRLLGAPEPDVVAGHSLGEYTALFAAGALDAASLARLVDARGRAMADAPGGTMAAVLGVEDATLEALCLEAPGTVVLANRNAPGQAVISGEPQAVAWLAARAGEMGARKVVPLQVSGAFHSPLMAGAQEQLQAALHQAPWTEPICPVVHNIDARANRVRDEFAERLARQLSSGVDWVGCVRTMVGMGVGTFVELGAGKTLSGLIRRIAPEVRCLPAAGPDELRAVATTLKGSGVPA